MDSICLPICLVCLSIYKSIYSFLFQKCFVNFQSQNLILMKNTFAELTLTVWQQQRSLHTLSLVQVSASESSFQILMHIVRLQHRRLSLTVYQLVLLACKKNKYNRLLQTFIEKVYLKLFKWNQTSCTMQDFLNTNNDTASQVHSASTTYLVFYEPS